MHASNAGNMVIQASQGTMARTRGAALASLLGGAVGNQSLTSALSGAVQDLVSHVQNGNTFVPSR